MTVFVRLRVRAAHRAPLRAALVARGHVPVDGEVPAGWTAVARPADVSAAAAAGASLWLRPLECGGPVSPFTALVLIRAAARTGRPWVCEGLGERAAAAALVCGAAGVVVDTPLWACPESDLGDDDRALLAEATTADSAVTGELDGVLVRSLVRGTRSLTAPQTVADARAGAGRPTLEVLDAWLAAVEARVAEGRAAVPCTTVCGPMANVTETPGFARVLSANGVLPFLALGALPPERAAARLAEWSALGVPYGVGLIGFDVMPHRDAQIAAVLAAARRPVAVTVAGGSAALALRLRDAGLDPWLHTPSARTLDAALDAGVRTVVLEGHEAGGHVGRTTSVGLWEDALARLEGRDDPRLVLAGGIGDAVSAAFACAMASRWARGGGALVLQAGTAFLLTHEAAECGNVTPTYQAEALRAEATVLVGSSVNLPLRCVPNDFTEEARRAEAALEAQAIPRADRRAHLEHRNLGRTRMAAKGIERNPAWVEGADAPRYLEVPLARQRAESAFTVGQGALVTGRLSTVAQVVAALGAAADALREGTDRPTGPFPPVLRVAGAAVPRLHRAGTPSRDGDVAIVGLGCVLPGALDVPAFWRNLVDGRSAIGLVPVERWAAERYFDPEAGATGPTKSYTRLGGVVRGFHFDPLPFRIPPRIAATLDPSQRMALVAASEALRSAGWDRGAFDRRRAAVVLGNAMGGEFSKSMALRVRFREVLDAVSHDPLTAGFTVEERRALEARVEERLAPHLPPVEVDSMAGLLSNVVAGRIAAWLDWMGGNLTVDAACAASLASVAVAVDWLRSGRCDAVLAGGVDTDLSPESYVGFCRTEALSRTGSQPFSARADGFVMGEGAAVLALVRLADAQRRGDRVLAVIRGVGQSSDGRGRGITAPRAEGQALALDRAWAESGREPADLGLVEAHGTGTALGDETEVGVLVRQFAEARTPTWLGSVKSSIGHLKGGAGAAALVKVTLALASGVVPPTLNAGPVHPDLPLTEGALRLPRLAVPLPRTTAAVSAFGFGGTNFHVVLERGTAADPLPSTSARVAVGASPALDRAWGRSDATLVTTAWGADTPEALREAVARGRNVEPEAAAGAAHRVAALGLPGEDVAARALRALHGHREPGVFSGSGPPAPVHLLFPGQGAQAAADERATRRMPDALARFAALTPAIEAATGRSLERLWADARDGEPVAVHAALFAVGVAHAEALGVAGVPIASAMGHSLGAFGAAVAAGCWSAEEALPLVLARGEALAACPEGRMVALRAGVTEAEAYGTQFGLSIAAVNAEDQVVVCGTSDACGALVAALGPGRAQLLAVRRAYHGPSVAPAATALALALVHAPAPLEPRFPLRSTRSTAVVGGRRLASDLVDAVCAPVRFHEALRSAGDGWFVDTGPGDTAARLAERAGLRAVALHGADGPARVATALIAAGHAGFARSLPATAVALALPAFVGTGVPAPVRGPAPVRDPAPVAAVATAGDAFAPPDAAPPDVDEVRSAVIAVVCEVTGYPADYVRDGVDLEADLGVDSIRKLEILGALEKRFGFATPEADYGALARADLASLAAHVERHRHRAPRAPETPVATEARFSVPLLRPAPPAVADEDVGRALDRLAARLRATPHGPVSIALRSDPAGVASAAFLRSWSRETGRPVDPRGAPPRSVLALAPGGGPPLPDGVVVLASGGLRGILAPCLAALADRRPRVVLLHRPGSAPAPGALPFLVVAVPGDVGSADDVERAVAVALQRFGRLDVVVHAAGVLHDGPADAQTDAHRASVLRPKWEGARNLIAATAGRPLSAFVTFSSLVAHLGNPGQTAYAAANAAMETLRHPTARTLHLAWTAWRDRGMAANPALARLLASRGVHALDPGAGAAAFRRLLESDTSGVIHVATQPLPDEVSPAWPLGALRSRTDAVTSFHLPLDPAEPWLADHRVGGRPLVPAAGWVAAMLEGARLTEDGAWTLTDLRVAVPTFVDRIRADARLELTHTTTGLSAEIVVDGTVVCRGLLTPACDPPDQPAPPPLLAAEDAAALYRPDLLFHGRAWQVLDRLRIDGDGFAADLRPAGVPSALAASVDGIHQLLAAMGDRRSGWLGLPVGAERWSFGPGGVPVRIVATTRTEGRELAGDVVALDAAGRVVVSGVGVRIRAARTTGAADA